MMHASPCALSPGSGRAPTVPHSTPVPACLAPPFLPRPWGWTWPVVSRLSLARSAMCRVRAEALRSEGAGSLRRRCSRCAPTLSALRPGPELGRAPRFPVPSPSQARGPCSARAGCQWPAALAGRSRRRERCRRQRPWGPHRPGLTLDPHSLEAERLAFFPTWHPEKSLARNICLANIGNG